MDLGPQPAGTFAGVALLGWMKQEQAVRFLLQDCIFERPLTEAEATALWHEWRERAASVPERSAVAAREFPLDSFEEEHAAIFLQSLAEIGCSGVRIVKTDPMQMIAAQYFIAVDQAASYFQKSESSREWISTALPVTRSSPRLEMNFTRRNLDTDIQIELPHAEFIFGVNMASAQLDGAVGNGSGPQGSFGPKELLRHVSTLRAGDRLLLGKGYHRIYARVAATEGRFPDRLSVVAVDPNTITPTSLSPAATDGGSSDSDGLDIFGARPALIADFFSAETAMPVYLRKMRYRLEVHARWVAVDADEHRAM